MAAGESHLFSVSMIVTDLEAEETHRQDLVSLNIPCGRPAVTLESYSTADLITEVERRQRQWVEWAKDPIAADYQPDGTPG